MAAALSWRLFVALKEPLNFSCYDLKINNSPALLNSFIGASCHAVQKGLRCFDCSALDTWAEKGQVMDKWLRRSPPRCDLCCWVKNLQDRFSSCFCCCRWSRLLKRRVKLVLQTYVLGKIGAEKQSCCDDGYFLWRKDVPSEKYLCFYVYNPLIPRSLLSRAIPTALLVRWEEIIPELPEMTSGWAPTCCRETDTCLSSLIPNLEEGCVLGTSVLESYC